MLPDYPLAQLHAFLVDQGAKALSAGDALLPPALAEEHGHYYALPAAWAPTGQIVLHFTPTFPDQLPRVYLPHGAARPDIVPHVNNAGQICCFHPSTVVKACDPVGIVTAVLAKAQAVWTKTYTPDEALAEIEVELAAYWERGKMSSLFLTDDTVEHHQLGRIIEVKHTSGKSLMRLLALPAAPDPKLAVALILDVPRARLLELITNGGPTLLSLPEMDAALRQLASYLGRSTRRKHAVMVWFVIRCATTRGPVLLACYLPKGFDFDQRHPDDFTSKINSALKSFTTRIHVRVQDRRLARLLARTAGLDLSDRLSDIRIVLAGCGSLGGFLADGLTRAGVRHWLLLDPDTLHPENLARHLLNGESLYQAKAGELSRVLQERFGGLEIVAEEFSAQTPAGRSCIKAFGSTLLLSATGDTNTDLTLSDACQRGEVGDCCFLWVEPNIAAGHLVFQPSGQPDGLHDLHEVLGGNAYYYRHRVIAQPRDLMQTEPGCQVAFTPYGGADLQLFAVSSVQEILHLFANRPTALLARRFRDGKWETIP